MINIPKNIVQYLANLIGYNITKISNSYPLMDKDKTFVRIYDKCVNFTMTSKERMYSLYKSVEYIVNSDIPGDFVECGVWRGGSAMLIAFSLIELNSTDRKVYLYDTFEGMSKPSDYDRRVSNNASRAFNKWEKEEKKGYNNWCFASLNEVENNMSLTMYPKDNLIFVKGKVEETIPSIGPTRIAILRLDTDWYESTRHELTHLYPLLVNNGVLILDDYGSWVGAKKAVDEYFVDKNILLNRIDIPGRIGVKI